MCEAGSTRRARARPNAAESAEEGASPPRLSDEVFALRTGPTPPAVSTAIVAAPRARSRGRRSERSGARNGPKESPKRAARGAHERRHHHPLRPAPTAGDSSETSVASRAPAPPMTKHHARPQAPHGGANLHVTCSSCQKLPWKLPAFRVAGVAHFTSRTHGRTRHRRRRSGGFHRGFPTADLYTDLSFSLVSRPAARSEVLRLLLLLLLRLLLRLLRHLRVEQLDLKNKGRI